MYNRSTLTKEFRIMSPSKSKNSYPFLCSHPGTVLDVFLQQSWVFPGFFASFRWIYQYSDWNPCSYSRTSVCSTAACPCRLRWPATKPLPEKIWSRCCIFFSWSLWSGLFFHPILSYLPDFFMVPVLPCCNWWLLLLIPLEWKASIRDILSILVLHVEWDLSLMPVSVTF